MKSIHNYVQYRCNPNYRYSRMQGKKSRISNYGARYFNLFFKRRKSVLARHSMLKENVRYSLCDSQYWMGCA